MKIQHYAIIFIIIILPFSIICKTLINKKIDTINEQTRINNALDTATNDAVDTLIELNDEFYALYEGETLNVTPALAREALKTFFESLAVNYNLPFTKEEKFLENYFSPYIPAVVIVAYDGFYIYSVEETFGTYGYALSSKIPYAYEENGYIINFTLGNSIKLYAPNGVLYEGEFKEDFIDDALTEYNEIEGILGSNTLDRLPQLTNDMSLIICAITKDNDYVNLGGSLLPILPSFLTTLSSDPNAIPMRQDYDDTHIDENTVSAFNIKRREIIINTIVTTLDEKINNQNRYADMMGVTYDFYLPEIDDAQWINAVDDVSVMAFMQGIPIGTDSYYNSFALGGSRIVEATYIYGTADNKYHNSHCPDLSGSFDIDGYPIDVAIGGSITEMFLNKVDAAKAGFNPCLKCKP